ncbi:MAG: glycosyltransferase family 2 protein, partial [Nocardioidaceae bacterium]|nr:glycosyltransferase family 2 protein [Nocardioidaceae bacterium]
MSPLFGRKRATPRLSVVVPVYNVEPYVAECLDSILGQDFQDFEVIVVDDGSTDGSAAVVEGYLGGGSQISMVHTDNHGLGAARNHGVGLARGELLAFVDSDDTLPPYAYALMVATLDESGSELVVGSLQQQTDGELAEPAFLRRAHRQRLLGVTLEEHPEAMRNVFAWDKVFRRSFWERAGLAFPEGVRYEDQGTIIEAYLRAEAFDVVVRPVYRWRIRSDGSSITQRRHEIADLRDRLATKQMATDVLRRLGSPRLLYYWARTGLPGDLPLYFREIPGCDDSYWQLLHTGVRDLFEGLPGIQESRLRVPQRVVGWLVTHGRRADAETLLTWVADNPGPLPLRVEGDHVVAE